MSRYSLIFTKAATPFAPTHSSFQQNYALHRSIGDIPDCMPTVDVFRENSEGRIIIVNPAPASKSNLYK